MAKRSLNKRGAQAGDTFIGERIREARLAAKMSQSDLGKKLNVSFQQVQKYEKGVNRVGGTRFNQIAAALDKPVTFFFANGDDVRSKADPQLTRFIASKEGLELASSWYRMSPPARSHLLGVIKTLVKEGA